MDIHISKDSLRSFNSVTANCSVDCQRKRDVLELIVAAYINGGLIFKQEAFVECWKLALLLQEADDIKIFVNSSNCAVTVFGNIPEFDCLEDPCTEWPLKGNTIGSSTMDSLLFEELCVFSIKIRIPSSSCTTTTATPCSKLCATTFEPSTPRCSYWNSINATKKESISNGHKKSPKLLASPFRQLDENCEN